MALGSESGKLTAGVRGMGSGAGRPRAVVQAFTGSVAAALIGVACSVTTYTNGLPGDGAGTDAAIVGSANIGSEGGSVVSADGHVTIVLPPNSLATPTTISINVASGAPSGVLGQAYDIEPTGTQFLRPVGLEFQYDTSYGEPGGLAVATVDGSGAWMPIPLSVADTKSIRAATTHLSKYGVFERASCSTGDKCEAPFQCVGGTCAMPCRSASDCPPPFGCDATGVCTAQSCSTAADCAAVAGGTPGAGTVTCEVPGICVNDTNPAFFTTAADDPGASLDCPTSPAGPPSPDGCPGVQQATCYLCGMISCPYYGGATGFPQADCGGNPCAYGFCWPVVTGCQCGQDGCACGSSDASASDGGSAVDASVDVVTVEDSGGAVDAVTSSDSSTGLVCGTATCVPGQLCCVSSSGPYCATSCAAPADSGLACGACTTNAQCQLACPLVPGGTNCCDTTSAVCYATTQATCPAPAPPQDAGTE